MDSGRTHPSGPFDSSLMTSRPPKTQPSTPWISIVQVTYTPLVTESLIWSSE